MTAVDGHNEDHNTDTDMNKHSHQLDVEYIHHRSCSLLHYQDSSVLQSNTENTLPTVAYQMFPSRTFLATIARITWWTETTKTLRIRKIILTCATYTWIFHTTYIG
jgi:hypothetical protein